MKEEPVDQIGGKTQRFPEIDEQDHARIGRVVPGLVLIGVIENDRNRGLQRLARKCKLSHKSASYANFRGAFDNILSPSIAFKRWQAYPSGYAGVRHVRAHHRR